MKNADMMVAFILSFSACALTPSKNEASALRDESSESTTPFDYYSRCGDEWSGLVGEWLNTDIVKANSFEDIEDIYAITNTTDSSAIGAALRAAWNAKPSQYPDVDPALVPRIAFFGALDARLSDACPSLEWMALPISDRASTDWPMSVNFHGLESKPEHDDFDKAMKWLKTIITYKSDLAE